LSASHPASVVAADQSPAAATHASPSVPSKGLPVRPQEAPPTADSFQLGPVHLEAAPGWWFYPMTDYIAGRPLSGVGVFQVRPIAQVRLPKPATHEVCMATAIDACGYQVQGPGLDPARDRIGKCVFGGESFRTKGTFVRVYYHHGPRGFAVATFSCKANRIVEKVVRQSIRDCDEMMLSVRLPSSHSG
jgi:hypothetical protein